MLRRLLLGQRKHQENEEKKEVILTTQNKLEKKCESEGESDTETEESDSETIDGSSVCSLDDSSDVDDTIQEWKGFKMVESHVAKQDLQSLSDGGNSDGKMISKEGQQKERREEVPKINNETTDESVEVGGVNDGGEESGVDDEKRKYEMTGAKEPSESERHTQRDFNKDITNDDNDNKTNKNSSNNDDSDNTADKNSNNNNSNDDNTHISKNNNINKNNSKNKSQNNRKISGGQSFREKKNEPEKRLSVLRTQSFTSGNNITKTSCDQVSRLQRKVTQQDHEVWDARARLGNKKIRVESLVKTPQPRNVEKPRPRMGSIKNIEKKRVGKKSQKSCDSYQTDISIGVLEKILGINIGELQDLVKSVKMKQGGKQDKQDDGGFMKVHSSTVTKECLVVSDASGVSVGDSGSSEDVKLGLSKDLEDILKGVRKSKKEMTEGDDEMVELRRSPDGCYSEGGRKDGEIEGNQDETSSDSGVSETDVQRYMSIKDIIKRKEHLIKEMADLDTRVVVMQEHKKDLQVVHDLFDLCNDELKDVERNNVGVPRVQSLKEILNRQIREMTDGEFTRKMSGLERSGVPHFTAIQEQVEKLRVKIHHALQDERKCRSKALQKMRFEYGKMLGMCEGILDCVFEE